VDLTSMELMTKHIQELMKKTQMLVDNQQVIMLVVADDNAIIYKLHQLI
jgi:hypothetical protein